MVRELLRKFGVGGETDDSGGSAHDDLEIEDWFGDHSTHADDGMVTDSDARANDRSTADGDVVRNMRRNNRGGWRGFGS